MYEDFYGFKFKPFELLPDPRFLYMSQKHDLALTHLEYGITDNKGFIVLTGDVGTGKTTLINFFLRKVDKEFNTALIYNTGIDPRTFLEMVIKDFGIRTPDLRRSTLYDVLYQFLLSEHSQGRRSILIIDEAQNMPKETLEEVRMLSNFETEECYLLQIVMAGQPQLRRRLKDPELAQLTQRVSVYYHLSPLDRKELKTYIDHRLEVAGYSSSRPLFTTDAMDKIFSHSDGVPRMVSAICDTALLYGYGDEKTSISSDIVDRVIQDREFVPKISSAKDSEMISSSVSNRTGFEEIEKHISKLEKRLSVLEQLNRDDAALYNLTEAIKEAHEENRILQKKYHILLLKHKMMSQENDKKKKKKEAIKRVTPLPSAKKAN